MTHCPNCAQELHLAKPGELCQACKRTKSGKPAILVALGHWRYAEGMRAMYARTSVTTGFGSQWEQARYSDLAEFALTEARYILRGCWQ